MRAPLSRPTSGGGDKDFHDFVLAYLDRYPDALAMTTVVDQASARRERKFDQNSDALCPPTEILRLVRHSGLKRHAGTHYPADPRIALEEFMGLAVNDSPEVAHIVGEWWNFMPEELTERLPEWSEVARMAR